MEKEEKRERERQTFSWLQGMIRVLARRPEGKCNSFISGETVAQLPVQYNGFLVPTRPNHIASHTATSS